MLQLCTTKTKIIAFEKFTHEIALEIMLLGENRN